VTRSRVGPADVIPQRLTGRVFGTSVNAVSGAGNEQHAWPNIEGSRPSNLFLCAPFTTEGNSYHPEWARSAATRYKTPDEPLVFALLQIQHLLDNTHLGRG